MRRREHGRGRVRYVDPFDAAVGHRHGHAAGPYGNALRAAAGAGRRVRGEEARIRRIGDVHDLYDAAAGQHDVGAAVVAGRHSARLLRAAVDALQHGCGRVGDIEDVHAFGLVRHQDLRAAAADTPLVAEGFLGVDQGRRAAVGHVDDLQTRHQVDHQRGAAGGRDAQRLAGRLVRRGQGRRVRIGGVDDVESVETAGQVCAVAGGVHAPDASGRRERAAQHGRRGVGDLHDAQRVAGRGVSVAAIERDELGGDVEAGSQFDARRLGPAGSGQMLGKEDGGQ